MVGPVGINLPDAGVAAGALGQVVAGLRGGAGVREFRAGIEAGQRVLGNRAFMQWVGALGAGWQAGAGTVRGGYGPALPDTAAPVPDRGPLQMMGGGKKKPGAAPEPLPKAESEAGESALGGEKKKKKSRVQVALNTLRGEGVEAFGSYIEAEIGEAALLRTLVERITRAQDLGGVRAGALARVAARLRLLEPLLARGAGSDGGSKGLAAVAPAQAPCPAFRHARAGLQPTEPAPAKAGGQALRKQGAGGQEPEIAVSAPARSEFSRREMECFQCCTSGDVRKFRRLLRFGIADINMSTGFATLLCCAAGFGHMAIAKELLSSPGIDVNLGQQGGATPLFLAAQERQVKMVRLLLGARGINVNLATETGVTPLFIAAARGFVEIVKLLLAVRGIEINTKRQDGTTPLLMAVDYGHEAVVRLLLAVPGIDIEARTKDEATALYIAVYRNFAGIAEQLVRWGVNVNPATDQGATPLYTAARRGHLELLKILLQAPGIQVNQTNDKGFVPLGVAAQWGHKDAVRLLLRHGADPNDSKSDTGLTPLHVACLQGHMAIVEMLLHAGADMEAELKEPGRITHTPYSLAELAGHRGMMSVLAAQRRRGEAVRRREQLPVTAAPGGDPGTPALPGKEVAGDTDAATARVSPVPPTPSPPGEAAPETQPSTPLAQAKDVLRQEVLGKLRVGNFETLEGIRLLEDVNDAGDLDSLCALYNRLAHIERRKERARRRRPRRRELPLTVEPEAAAGAGPAAAPVFTLGEKTGLDADTIEDEIKRYLDRAYHRFVGQAVNDMEFGRGKPTAGYPGLLHASAGVPGVGSCSVFYYLDSGQGRIRIMGIGYHVGRAAYRLDYATGGLGEAGRMLRIA